MCSLGDRTVLEEVLGRCASIPGVDVVVCAVPDKPESETLEALTRACGAEVYRGSETDVLQRYLGAARAANADVIMRVTSDCPLIDPEICGAVLRLRATEAADYASNNLERTFPHGLDCEAFTTPALIDAEAATQLAHDREHVTPWLRRSPGLKRVNLAAREPYHVDERWTLDYPEDLSFMQAVFSEMPKMTRGYMADILAILDANPALRAINAHRRLVSEQ
ncbi:glycosyltransferase family protein [Tardiphaga alba]|nr:glycosyltransferase family protein [Tardiphaga alba]